MRPIQLAQQSILTARANNALAEAKPEGDIISGVYLGYDNGGYQFRTGNGGTIKATLLSTSEPAKGETYILVRTPGTDIVTAKPKPRL